MTNKTKLMENENEVVDETTNEDVETSNNNEEQNPENEPDVKTLQAQKQHWKEKYEKLKSEKSEPKSVDAEANKSKEFDYANLAVKTYLKTEGVDNTEDQDWILKEAKDLQKDVTELLGKKYYQEELKDRVSQREAESAAPDGKGRGSNKTQADPDYWINKGELPKDQETAIKVVNAKMKADDSNRMFD